MFDNVGTRLYVLGCEYEIVRMKIWVQECEIEMLIL